MTFKRILVPVDFSAASKKALDMAIAIAARLDASIEVMHAVEYPVYAIPDMTVAVAGAAPMAFERYARESATRDMERFIGEVVALRSMPGVQLTPRIVEGEASRSILEYAKQGAFDLIVMGTHGRTGLDHLLLGSVAERVVRKAPCAVLTTRDSSPS